MALDFGYIRISIVYRNFDVLLPHKLLPRSTQKLQKLIQKMTGKQMSEERRCGSEFEY